MSITRPATAVAVMLALALLMASCTGDGGDEAAPTTTSTTEPAGPPVELDLEGPITGGERDLPYNAMPAGYEEKYGYTEQEYFASGTATAFTSAEPLTADGEWTLAPGDTADYTTRILVRQPADPKDFNGVVLVEWNNVTAGRDSDPDFGFLHPEVFREGYAYIAVSAQQVSIEGGKGLLEVPGVPAEAILPLKEWDPERYAPLNHPGDAFSYDIFTQIGALAKGRASATPFPDLEVDKVLAVGESQSAFRLVSYVDGVHPLAQTYDGFLIHSRGASGAALGEGANTAPPDGLAIRTDLTEPVLQLETETDLVFLRFLGARQADTDRVITWEVAGAAHADQSQLDYGIASGSRWSDATVDFSDLCGSINTGPQPEVTRASLERLRAWVQEGIAPPASPRIEADDSGALVRGPDGNVLGGIRTPDVDAPVSTLTGEGNPSSIFCSLFGQEIPFSADRLAALYPTHDAYVEKVTASADDAVDAGFLLEADRDAIVAAAIEADIGG